MNKIFCRHFFAISILLNCINVYGQELTIIPSLLTTQWPSSWIACQGAEPRGYGVYHFRKNFLLNEKPSSFIIHVSADNRYRLFVNGKPVMSGPARGDLYNWFYETIDIAPYLQPGANVIAAMVWNMGTFSPVAQISNQTGFVLQGDSQKESLVNSNTSWTAFHNLSYSPCSTDNGERLRAYMVVGPGDSVYASQFPWGWELPGYNDKNWSNAISIASPEPLGHGTDNLWTMAPRSIPLFEEKKLRINKVRRSTVAIDQQFLYGAHPLTIAAGQRMEILLDEHVNTSVYPELLVSGGKGASIKLTYAESLTDAHGNKGNRDETEGKTIAGNYDIFLPDGGSKRLFRPLWLRPHRYLQLDITTGSEPLVLEDIYVMQTGYPLKENATFSSDDPSLKNIWDVGWRTAQLCAGDLYYDCPYYEQLQYTGDSRIQALISLYVSGDDRLMRKALLDFYHSRTPEGLTQGRYPSNRLQIITTFSLFWVSMVHDYWMHRNDDAFVKQFLPAISEIMTWFEKYTDTSKNMLGPMPWWNYVDWDNFGSWGEAPGAHDGNSSIMSLQYSYTLQDAADLFEYFDKKVQADEYRQVSKSINRQTYELCFDASKGLVADGPSKKTFSQHANIWAVLSSTVTGEKAKRLMNRVLSDSSIGQCTFFYRFYLTQALKKAGMSELYYSQLQPWRDMLNLGLTTFAEKKEPTRSDCHAWSASPNYDFLATICGIMPGSAGFASVVIAPALGQLTEVQGRMPHPQGDIAVSLRRVGLGVHAEISLPESLRGEFIWKGQKTKLNGGRQVIDQE